MADVITLTPEQENIILEAFNKPDVPSIVDLIKLAFPGTEADGRSKWGRAIKILLSQRGLKATTTTEYIPVEKIELNDAQKEFIRNNRATMNPMEMGKILFNNPALSNLNIETRTISEYIKSLDITSPLPEIVAAPVNDVPEGEYSPPKSISGALQRVDKYVFTHGIDKETMTAQQKAGLEALLSYLNTFRFVHQINLYESQASRNLFESSFVRYTYDKPDLTEEEVDQYINVSHDNVSMSSTQVRMEHLSAMMDEVTTQDVDERARISMSLVEAINSLSTEYNQIAKRQQSLLGDLKQKRSDRIAQLRSANASILNLVQLWKEERSRLKLIHLADAKKELLKKSVGELSEMSELHARVLGLNPEEIING